MIAVYVVMGRLLRLPQVFGPASYPAAALLAISPLMPLAWNAGTSSFLFLVCMSQQFHAWSHMKKSELPPAVVALQVRPTGRVNAGSNSREADGNGERQDVGWNSAGNLDEGICRFKVSDILGFGEISKQARCSLAQCCCSAPGRDGALGHRHFRQWHSNPTPPYMTPYLFSTFICIACL